jgi:hypothetical protein
MPPKSKKQKLNHQTHQSTEQSKELTHNQIWDDSALINSWNDAVKEYEYYHSLMLLPSAERERILDEEERREEAEVEAEDKDREVVNGEKGNGVVKGGEAGEDGEEGEIDEDNGGEEGEVDEDGEGSGAHGTKVNGIGKARSEAHGKEHGPVLPPGPSMQQQSEENGAQARLQDQTLENLKMAYYWAGYYSGLYDGQQQGRMQAQGP